MKTDRSRIVRQGKSSIGTILFVCLIVNIGILFAAPFVRALYIKKAMRIAEHLLSQNQPAPALQQLERIYPWASRYPTLAFPVESLMLRCYLHAGEIDQAQRYARSLQDHNEGPDRDIASSLKPPLLWLESLPNNIYNSIEASSPEAMSSPSDGKDSVKSAFAELKRSDLLVTLKLVDAPTPKPSPSPLTASPQRKSELRPRPQAIAKTVSQQLKPVSPTASTSSPEIAYEAPHSNAIPHPPSKEDIAKRQQLAQLRADASYLTNKIAGLHIQLEKINAIPLTPSQQAAQNRYSLAKQQYNQFGEQNTVMIRKMDKSSGPRRMELLDQLRARRFQEVTYQKNVHDAKVALEQACPATIQRRDIEKQIQTLSAQLGTIYEKLQVLQRQAGS